MSLLSTVKSWLQRRRKRLIGCLLIGVLFYGLARTSPVIDFAWQQARGTTWEPTVIKWAMSIHGPPVERAIARGKIFEGQPVEEVIAHYGPFRTTALAEYTLLNPPERNGSFEGYQIVVKDGHVRSAHWWTCVAQLEFFNSLSREEEREVNELYEQRQRFLRDARQLTRLALVGSWAYPDPLTIQPPDPLRDARMAVAGLGAYIEPQVPHSPHDD
ncbi:hypothetical protein [Limnoglobus roseus]|uniref:Uncharacterized protein n=1 Tax=Limnoglobus roseus TaxID=2598579 RepID=A0A5C1AM24_9BACT|nr:hypothetical protein [Limnoglobus roseus]QEL18224.1 hypothetical protein PX52LOC_05240 [Limnoglobus roseus]